jgi:hypothetical protein
MSNNKNPNQKQPGEKEPGKFHYNPGNMSGKTIESCEDNSDRVNADRDTRDTIGNPESPKKENVRRKNG